MWVPSLSPEDPLEEGMATHFSILAWRVPWTEEPGRLWSIGSHRVRHNWSNLAHTRARNSAEHEALAREPEHCPYFLQWTDFEQIILKQKLLMLCCVWAQSCPTLSDPMDCSLPASSIHGILQARILEWAAISYSRGSSQPRNRTHVSCVSCFGRQILCHGTTWDAQSC